MLKAMSPIPTVGILVRPRFEQRLRAAHAPVWFEARSDWLELAFFDLESKPAAFIVDPSLITPSSEFVMLHRLGARQRAPVILYAEMTPALAPRLLELGPMGIRHVMLYGVDDTPKRIRALLVEELSRCIRREQS